MTFIDLEIASTIGSSSSFVMSAICLEIRVPPHLGLGIHADNALVDVNGKTNFERLLDLREAICRQVPEIQLDVALCEWLQEGLEIVLGQRRVLAEHAIHLERDRNARRIRSVLHHIALIDEPEVVADDGGSRNGHNGYRDRNECGRPCACVAEKTP